MQDSLEPIFIEEKRTGDDNGINVEKVLSKIVAYWPLFALCTVVSLSVAYVYMRYATPKYNINAKVLIKDDKQGGMGDGQILQDLGLQGNAANVENEVEIFKSRTLMTRVVGEQELNIHYYAPGRIKTSEYYYTDLPFRLIPIYDNRKVEVGYNFDIEINKGGYTITDKKKTYKGGWGDTVTLPVGKMVVMDRQLLANPDYDLSKCAVKIKPTEYQAKKLLRTLDVAAISNKTNIIELSISDALPQRGEQILDKLIEAYLQANVDDRNATMDATVVFIDDRLQNVTGELSGIEKDIEAFKSANRLTDLTAQSKMLLDNTSEFSKMLTENEVKLRVIESMQEYLQDGKNKDRIAPSALLSDNDAAMSAMQSYNDLQLKKSSLLLTNTEDNPYVKNIDKQLDNIREDLMRSLAAMKQGVQVSIAELKNKAGYVDNEIKKVPTNERMYLEYARQQAIKQELYLFLLKKREETAISKSSTVANARIVDAARSEDVPFSPKGTKVYLAALALGLILPGMWVFLKEVFNVKITGKEDVKRATGMNIIAQIGHNDNEEEVVVQKESRSIIAEQFRSLRTNMQFLLADKESRVILLTSSMSGEGKSFVALNMAVTLALSGEKVILLELDLRKPKISSHLGISSREGFTKYIIGQADVEAIIHPSGIINNLDVVPAGAIPPNPSELLLSPKVMALIAQLKRDYDYVVIDSAPVGLVTDAQLLAKYADAVLYVSRMNYTFKEQLRNADELYRSGKIPGMSLVLNDVKSRQGAYGYGYGYGSYTGDVETSGLAGKMKKLRKK